MKKIVQRTKRFEKCFGKIVKKQQLLFLKKLDWFLVNEFDKRLTTHRLKGKRKNEYSFSVSDDVRAVYTKEVVKNKEIIVFTFIDIGTHSKVY